MEIPATEGDTGANRVGATESARFRDDGFFVLEAAFGSPQLEAMQRAADDAMASERQRLLRGEERFVPVSRVDDRYVVSGYAERDPAMHAVAFGDVMIDVCRATLGRDAYLFSDTFVCKAPRSEHGWIWHQDSSYLDHLGLGHHPPNLSVWIALDDMTATNGALRVMPFSTAGIREVVRHDLTKEWTRPDVVDFGDHANVLLEMPAGSVVAFHGALPHASDPNRTDRPRRAYLLQYSAVPILQDGKPVQRAIPVLQGGVRVPAPRLGERR